MQPDIHRQATILTFFFWEKCDKGKHSDFLVFQYCSQSSLMSLRHKVHKNNILLIQRDCTYDFFCSWCILEFLLPSCCSAVLSHWLLLGFGFKTVDPDLIPPDNYLWHEALTTYIALVQKIRGGCFACLFVCTPQNSWPSVTTDLQTASTSITIITLPFLMGRAQHNSSVVMWQTLHVNSSTWCMFQSSSPCVSASFICPSHHHTTLMSTAASL